MNSSKTNKGSPYMLCLGIVFISLFSFFLGFYIKEKKETFCNCSGPGLVKRRVEIDYSSMAPGLERITSLKKPYPKYLEMVA